MSELRLLAVGCALLSLALPSAASAQDCDRYAWACQGSGWQRYQTDPYGSPYPGNPYGNSYPASPYGTYPARPRYEPPGPRAPRMPDEAAPALDPATAGQYGTMYARVSGEPFPVPAVKLTDIDPAFLRKSVSYPSNEAAGTIVIDPANHFLYLVQGNGRAMRYGVGVGRQGFGWSGVATIHDKQEWPDWYPPKEMLQRQPDLMRQMSELRSGIGMPGGPRNPLGARAMYLWQGNKDTLYRIHGTVEPWTIGKSVSSGCIRMINQDVMDLYGRIAVGAKVVVIAARGH